MTGADRAIASQDAGTEPRAGADPGERTATVPPTSGTFPSWFTRTGYALGAVLLVGVILWDWVILVLPAWVAGVSLFILRRERSRLELRP